MNLLSVKLTPFFSHVLWCCQVSSDWSSSEILSHCQAIAIGVNDFSTLSL
ncbi:Tethering factor for nuclear proteasome STS1 [Gossypium arboreum]|uniref:Tethering factor for nuclear proteasome STS1 n=1 Tax=Gossypium arboreum TaxID=29729 RepID=A0A0B0MCM9_GOSAR|nr:Tethering factor for nuclear proteasome STS1 [Gossypium arboreum]